MTHHAAFLKNKEVALFVRWMAHIADRMKVKLAIPASPKVPGGVHISARGLNNILPTYKWNSSWQIGADRMASRDWTSTKQSLNRLSQHLQAAVSAKDDFELLEVCEAVLRWGGDRSRRRGAFPFLCSQPDLAEYLKRCTRRLKLTKANLSNLNDIKRMNSMLTKIHALLAKDGLPIYDSRVAFAIASLVEIYRRNSQPSWTEIPELLRFPSLDPARDVAACFNGAFSHGSLALRGPDTTLPWTQAKVRLGWLLKKVLQKRPTLLANTRLGGKTMAGRLHAFEATLFMIGYNAACLSENASDSKSFVIEPQSRGGAQEKLACDQSKKWISLKTLDRGRSFHYSRDRDTGAVMLIAARNLKLVLTETFLDYVCIQFKDEGWVKGGFSRDNHRKISSNETSFGEFIERESPFGLGVSLSRQHASRIAATLGALGLCISRKKGRSVELLFG